MSLKSCGRTKRRLGTALQTASAPTADLVDGARLRQLAAGEAPAPLS